MLLQVWACPWPMCLIPFHSVALLLTAGCITVYYYYDDVDDDDDCCHCYCYYHYYHKLLLLLLIHQSKGISIFLILWQL